MDEPFFSQEIPSRPDAVSPLLDAAIGALTARRFASATQGCRLRLCLEEALVNAVRHGNQGNAQLSVRLELHEAGDTCLIRIYDRGGGFDPHGVQMSEPDQAGGRGVCLMRHFMDKIAYNDRENCLELWFGRRDCRVEERTDEQ